MQQTQNPVQAAQELYDQGKFGEALELVNEFLGRDLEEEQYRQLVSIKAWCHYRRKEYDQARSMAKASKMSIKSQELLATIAAYVDKDDQVLSEIAEELQDNAGVANALIIKARDSNAVFYDHIRVADTAFRFRESGETVHANIWHNAARYFLAKKRGTKDLNRALGFIEGALALYGDGDKNLHHRAAANFWKSKILEELFGKEAARASAHESRKLWERQVELDPSTEQHKKQLENAMARVRDVEGFTPA